MADEDPAAAADPSRVDLDAVQSLAAFAAACNQLRASRSYAALERAARPHPLPKATLSDLLNAKSTPTRETVIAFLTACGLDDEAQHLWLAAWERVATAHQPRPGGAVRVRDARPRLLGVHAAIQVADVENELPPYVPRDLDADLRTAVTAAAASGGLVLLVGGSSVGKTRALLEAVRAVLPEWWLLHPADTPAISAHAAAPTPRTVLWLDELQRYLNHPAGLTVGAAHRLITAGTVVVATLWPDEYRMRTTRPNAGQPDPYAEDREVLRLAHIIRVPDEFTAAERRRGEALAGTDRRLRIALDTTDAGFTQVLAAGPALIQRWEATDDCYGQAVITAALDARRVGTQHPANRDFLEAATPAYLTPAQQATAPPDWLEHALAYATTPVHGATGCLTPVPAGMGTIAGWTAADYLHQHARRARRTTLLPDPVWKALVAHHHPDDTTTLADNAQRRGRPDDAITLYRYAAHRGDGAAAVRLADMLVGQGRVGEALGVLREHADAGDPYATNRLADVLAEQGRVDELHERADAGDGLAASRLADVLAEQGRVDELHERADAGDGSAASRLADVLGDQDRLDEALGMLREHADAGDGSVASRLADVLAKQGRVDELRERADAGDGSAAARLADVLAEQGRVDELHERADADDRFAAARLADVLAEQGRVDELRERADAGDGSAAARLADVLAEQGRVDELRERADADADDWYAAYRLADVLAEQGRVDELRERADAGNRYAPSRLADVLAEQGRVDELRERADAGDWYAALGLIGVLAEQGRIEAIRDEMTAGTPGAANTLRDMLRSS